MNILHNKTPTNWRNYSPGGKRRKITNIPFMGQVSDIKAQGTKRIGVLPVKFAYNYMSSVNFMSKSLSGEEPLTPIHRGVKYKYLTEEQKKALTPEQLRILRQKQEDEDYRTALEDSRAVLRNARANYRAGLSTVSEGRGWLKLIGIGN